jgi:hypothetical protein
MLKQATRVKTCPLYYCCIVCTASEVFAELRADMIRNLINTRHAIILYFVTTRAINKVISEDDERQTPMRCHVQCWL